MNIVFDSGQFDIHEWRRAFQAARPDLRLLEPRQLEADEIDVLLTWRPTITDWSRATRLKVVIGLGAGIDGLIRHLRLPPETPVERLRDAGMRQAMCEYASYAILHFQRHFDRFRQAQHQNTWLNSVRYIPPENTRVGVLGLGSLGSEIARHLRTKKYVVSGWSRTPKAIEGVVAYAGEDALQAFLRGCDILINMLPATETTEHFLNRTRLLELPCNAAVVCLSRGSVTDEQALLELLNSGHLRGAFMDVFTEEPLSHNSPLWSHPNVWITPHQSGPTLSEPAVEEIVEILKRRKLLK